MTYKNKLDKLTESGLVKEICDLELDVQIGGDGSRYTRILQLVEDDWEEFWIRLDDNFGSSEGVSHEFTR